MNAKVDLAGVKVLVIDVVTLAEDGFDGLSKIVEHSPDIVFCDIMMPRLDGYQTCSLVRQNPQFAKLPFVMLSSKDGLFDRARGAMVGSTEYLTKPFTRESLLNVVALFRHEKA
jgi:twitching motility two-component system response regulator PilG